MTTPKMIEDSEWGPIRLSITDDYIRAGQPTPEENWLYSRLVEARKLIHDARDFVAGTAGCECKLCQEWRQSKEKFGGREG